MIFEAHHQSHQTMNNIEDQEEKTPLGRKSGLGAATGYVKSLLNAGPEGTVGKGLEMGLGAILSKTVLKRLPVPFNFLAPYIAEKVIVKYGVDGGREVLLQGLRWVKKVTDEDTKTPEY